MEELVNLVAQKTNLPPDQARQVVQTVLDFLKQQLPAPLAGQLDALLGGGGGQLAQGLGGLLGDN